MVIELPLQSGIRPFYIEPCCNQQRAVKDPGISLQGVTAPNHASKVLQLYQIAKHSLRQKVCTACSRRK
jgi:hypothetical protein